MNLQSVHQEYRYLNEFSLMAILSEQAPQFPKEDVEMVNSILGEYSANDPELVCCDALLKKFRQHNDNNYSSMNIDNLARFCVLYQNVEYNNIAWPLADEALLEIANLEPDMYRILSSMVEKHCEDLEEEVEEEPRHNKYDRTFTMKNEFNVIFHRNKRDFPEEPNDGYSEAEAVQSIIRSYRDDNSLIGRFITDVNRHWESVEELKAFIKKAGESEREDLEEEPQHGRKNIMTNKVPVGNSDGYSEAEAVQSIIRSYRDDNSVVGRMVTDMYRHWETVEELNAFIKKARESERQELEFAKKQALNVPDEEPVEVVTLAEPKDLTVKVGLLLDDQIKQWEAVNCFIVGNGQVFNCHKGEPSLTMQINTNRAPTTPAIKAVLSRYALNVYVLTDDMEYRSKYVGFEDFFADFVRIARVEGVPLAVYKDKMPLLQMTGNRQGAGTLDRIKNHVLTH